MVYNIKIEKKCLGIPIQVEQPEELMEIFCGDEKIFEFQVPVCKDMSERQYDFYSYLNLEKYKDKILTVKGEFDDIFLRDICQCDTACYEPLKRPLIHFTPDRGWINDPNGLVYYDGKYHLYFQYNPLNTQWQNMSWGHSISTDLLRFEQRDTVLYPDEYGPVFSGCGLVNKHGLLGLPNDALLFYYSAAGGVGKWSQGKLFTQRIAFSVDSGETFIKFPREALGELRTDTRDPKVFWHEKSQAYVMVLWMEGNEFGFFRSIDLANWEQTDSIVLDEAWECPDLVCIDYEGEEIWVFMSADGFYYFGTFDGYKYETDKVRRYAYQTKLPYAAQTYSNISGRIVSVPWLRTKNRGKLYTGMMGLPRELSVVKRGSEKYLAMLPVREYEREKQMLMDFIWDTTGFTAEISEDVVTEIVLNSQESVDVQVQFFGQSITIRDNEIFYREERTVLPETLTDIHMIIDRDIVEIYGNDGTLNAYYETDSDVLCGMIHIIGGSGKGTLFAWHK